MGVIFTPDQAPRISLSAPAVPVPPFSRLRRVRRPAPMPRPLRGDAMATPALGHSTARVWSSARAYRTRRRVIVVDISLAVPDPFISSPLTCTAPVTPPLKSWKRNMSPLTVPSMGTLPPTTEFRLPESCPVTLVPLCCSVSSTGPPPPEAVPVPELEKLPRHTPVTSTVTSVCSIQSGRAHPVAVSTSKPKVSHAMIVPRASLRFVPSLIGGGSAIHIGILEPPLPVRMCHPLSSEELADERHHQQHRPDLRVSEAGPLRHLAEPAVVVAPERLHVARLHERAEGLLVLDLVDGHVAVRVLAQDGLVAARAHRSGIAQELRA